MDRAPTFPRPDTPPPLGAAPAPDAIPLRVTESGVHVPLEDGREVYFNAYWLRDNCPSAFDPETRERIFDIAEGDADPAIAGASLEGDILSVRWAHEDHESRYPVAALAEWDSAGRAPDPAALPRRLWRADAHAAFVRVSQPAVLADPAERRRFARALIEDGIAIVEAMPDSDAGLTDLAQSLGPVTPTTDGFYFDVRLEIAPTNLAFTANALELHTDLPNEQLAPGVQFLHCRANTVAGGASLFVDGAAAAEAVRVERPEDFELLARHRIPFSRRHDHWDSRARQTVIALDRDGHVEGLAISQHLLDAIDMPQEDLDRYYPAFRRFLRTLREPRFLNRFRLDAGQCVVFDNHRIVHGREAFSADRGARRLRGCYIDRGALRSAYRVLAGQR